MIPHSKPWLLDEDLQSIAAVIQSGMIGQGEQIARFERELAEWVGTPFPGVAVGSGSAALLLILASLNIGPGDEVALPTYVCHSVLEAVLTCGATPLLCDVGETWLLTPDNVAQRISPRTRAVIVPHLYGVFADVASFRALGVTVIEDCAQAIAGRGKRPVAGDVALFSFHPTKCLTSGEGGMVVSADRSILERSRLLRDGDGRIARSRFFSPMSDLNAALGLSQLSRFERALDRRSRLGLGYLSHLWEFLDDRLAALFQNESMFFRFPMLVEGGLDRFERPFRERGIIVRRGVDRLLHRMAGLSDAAYPMATALFESTVSLPLYPALTDEEHQHCVGAARDIFQAAGASGSSYASRAGAGFH